MGSADHTSVHRATAHVRLTVLLRDALLPGMRRVFVVLLAVISLGASVGLTGCRTQESRVCDADRDDLKKALASLQVTALKPDDVQRHKELRDQLGALSKRVEANRVPRLDTEDPSELTMRALDKLALSESSIIEALDPAASHPLSAAQLADTNLTDARAELVKALQALRAQCEK